MATTNLGQLVHDLYAQLHSHDIEVQVKAIAAVQVLLDHPTRSVRATTNEENGHSVTSGRSKSNLELADNARDYFDQKQPNAKIEELAVAVRFIELSTGNDSITKSDVQDVVLAARRDFDSDHFVRDVNNARFKGLFSKSRDKGVLTLSHYGQAYVDALPNREELGALAKPTRAGRRKSKRSTVEKRKRTAASMSDEKQKNA